jgi:drug/metabolite transporter (DMT)-like permease
VGIALFAGGNILNFVSFGFAAQSLLAALGSVQFLSNVVFARFVLHEAITPRVLCATALIIVGCILLVSFGNHQSELLTAAQLMNNYKK